MKHFTLSQRYELRALLAQHTPYRQIGKHLGKSPSAISREVSSNGGKNHYDPEQAHRRYYQKRQRAPYKFTAQLQQEIIAQLQQDYSPEQISQRRAKDHLPTVSHERIYLFVYGNKAGGGCLYIHLRRSGRCRKKRGGKKDNRGIIPNKRMIAERPAIVQTKERFGDFEGDTIIGKRHRGAIVVLTERKSKYTLAKKVPTRSAENVTNAIVELLASSPIGARTLTVDNGKEFAWHELIAACAHIDVFFANPYHSWERGLNENTNGLLRQYFPKSSDFTVLSDQQVNCAVRRLNTRPRKLLDFESPIEYFFNPRNHSTVASHT